MQARSEQVAAMGGVGSCSSPGSSPAAKSNSEPPASVVVIDPNKKAWIGLELKDRRKRPVPGADYEVVLPDGEIVTGTLDRNGKCRIEGIDPGTCKVTFPKLDRREFLQNAS